MRAVAEGLIQAFSAFSIFPMPKRGRPAPSREGAGYLLCFLPLVGMLICVAQLLWFELCRALDLDPVLFGAGAAILGVFLSRGAHLEGFAASADALASHGVREKKLALLHQDRGGWAGTAAMCCLLLAQLGLWTQAFSTPGLLVFPALGAVLSRGLFALSLALPPSSAKGARAPAAKAALAGTTLAVLLSLAFLARAAPLRCAVTAGLLAAWFLAHRCICTWEFGGNSYPLAGLLLVGSELLCLAAGAF